MIVDHAYEGELRSGASCQYRYAGPIIAWQDALNPVRTEEVCARQAMEHSIIPKPELNPYEGKSLEDLDKVMESSEYRNPGTLVRAADAAQYARPAIPEEQRGQIRVRLLNATPDPLGSVAALIEQYKGNVIRSLSEVTDEQRRAALADMSKTVLSGPLEAVQFHWQIEGVTRSITHQMVRSRASFFAQESLRFAVPEGNWADEIPLPPYLQREADGVEGLDLARSYWTEHMQRTQYTYENLINCGMPAEEARGILPHDMPTRIHWVCDLRTLLAEAGKRTCTQAQFPWRMIFAGMASALRTYPDRLDDRQRDATDWQFVEIANALRPVCFQTGHCGFMAQFDRSCKIRGRVDAFAAAGVDPAEWGLEKKYGPDGVELKSIADYEWAADPSAARS